MWENWGGQEGSSSWKLPVPIRGIGLTYVREALPLKRAFRIAHISPSMEAGDSPLPPSIAHTAIK